MVKIKQKTEKPISFRPHQLIGEELKIQAKEFGVSPSEIVECALECFLSHKDCPAREKLWQKTHKYNALRLKHEKLKP